MFLLHMFAYTIGIHYHTLTFIRYTFPKHFSSYLTCMILFWAVIVITFFPVLFKPSRISPNLRTTVYCSAIAEGGVVEWDFAWGMYRNATIASEAEKLLYALSCTKQPWLLNRSVAIAAG